MATHSWSHVGCWRLATCSMPRTPVQRVCATALGALWTSMCLHSLHHFAHLAKRKSWKFLVRIFQLSLYLLLFQGILWCTEEITMLVLTWESYTGIVWWFAKYMHITTPLKASIALNERWCKRAICKFAYRCPSAAHLIQGLRCVYKKSHTI